MLVAEEPMATRTLVGDQLRVVNDGAGPSGVGPGRSNQSEMIRVALEIDRSVNGAAENPARASSQLGNAAHEDDSEYSQSLLQDLFPRMPPEQIVNRPEARSQSNQRMSVPPTSDQSQPVRIHVRLGVSSQNNTGTDQSASQNDDDDLSEMIHGPRQRHRVILDSLTEEGVPQADIIDLSQLLVGQSTSSVVVTNQSGQQPRIRVVVPAEYDDDTESGDDDGGSDTVVIGDSDSENEPMEVEGAVDEEVVEVDDDRHTVVVVDGAPTRAAPAPVPALREAAAAVSFAAQHVGLGLTPTAPASLAPTAPASLAPIPSGPLVPGPSSAHTASSSATGPTDDSNDFKSPKRIVPGAKSVAIDDSDDDSQSCIICYEPWTNSGDHRLASLKCGHLFGHCCILKWLKVNIKCPQCNAKAKKSDIRIIYAKSLRAVDTSERDRALDDLRKEKEMRRKAEIDTAQANLRYRMALEEMNRLKSQMSTQLDQLRNANFRQQSSSAPGQSMEPSSQSETAAGAGQYTLDKTIQISQNGSCRVMGFDQFRSSLVVSMPTPNQLFPGFGIKKVSAVDVRCTQYVPIHSAMIRALAFNGRNDGLLLTASVDKTIKITSLVSNTVVQTYKTDAPAWSCAWNSSDINYVYAGLQNGAILVYDTRQVNGEVQRLALDNTRWPIVSLNYVPRAADQDLGCAGLLVGSLGGMSFWEQTSDVEFKPHLLQMDGNCTSLSFNNNSRHCLASFRPNKDHSRTRHVMCELKNERNAAMLTNEVACYPVQTFYGGPTMKLLTHSILYQSPSHPDQLYACSGDEATSSALIWDTTTGNQMQKLPVNATVLDVCSFQFNGHSFLAAQTEKQVKLYRWQPTR